MKYVVILSGGLDSTVLLHHLYHRGHELRALSIDYGQRHKVELHCAGFQANSLGVPFTVVDLSSLAAVLPGSSQTSCDVPVPEGHYEEESMKLTVVPNRNMILLSVALGHAVAHKFDGVAYGAHAGDHAVYPDCRKEFVDALNDAAALCDWHPVSIVSPFVGVDKAHIVKMGDALDVDFAHTYSCYAGKEMIHCGRCGTCSERLLAFDQAGVVDPVTYADREFYKTLRK